MKTKLLTDYLSPEIEMVMVATEGILCGSNGVLIDSMNIVEGDNSEWDWK